MTSGRGPNTAWISPATSVLIADRQCASRHCRNHSISRAPPVAALLGPSLAASAVRRSSPTCTHRAWRSRRAMEGEAAILLADVRSQCCTALRSTTAASAGSGIWTPQLLATFISLGKQGVLLRRSSRA